MASILKHLRSSTADKRPTASGLAEGQIAINTASGSPGIFFKDSNSNVVKVGPVHVGAAAPNASPAGSAGNSLGELWVDNSLTTPGLNYYSGSAFVNLTPSGTTTTVGLVELATNAETQTGSDAVRAVTPAGLQSKVSDSISTTSSITIASATAVKTAYDLANAALPKSGGTVTGEILISPSGSLVFEGSSDDSFETTLAVVNPTADRTITLPNITGTVVTTGDTGSVTSTMIADGTIVNADINASAAIDPSKLGSGALPSGVTVASDNIVDGTIINADVNASAAIAGTKISPNFGGQNVVTTGSVTGASLIPSSSTVPTNGLYLPAANTVALSTASTGRLLIDSSGRVGIGTTSPFGKLHVQDDSSDLEMFLIGPSAGSTRIRFGDNADTNIGQIIYDNTSDSLQIHTNNAERARIDSSGRLGIGTSSPSQKLSIGNGSMFIQNSSGAAVSDLGITFALDANTQGRIYSPSGKSFAIQAGTAGSLTDALTVDQSGRVGIGTASPSFSLDVSGSGAQTIRAITTDTSGSAVGRLRAFYTGGGGGTQSAVDLRAGDAYAYLTTEGSIPLLFGVNLQERARIDSSGRLLVGTSSSIWGGNVESMRTTGLQYVGGRFSADNFPAEITLLKSRGASVGTNTIIQNNDVLGNINFLGADGTTYLTAVQISAQVDGTPGTNDMPSRLIFSTTADGASSPTERMRITSAGNVGIGTTPTSRLHVKGGASGTNVLVEGNASSDYTYFETTSPSGARLQLVANGTDSVQVRGVTNHPLSFYTNNTERARIDTSGRLLVGMSSTLGGNNATVQIAGNSSSAGLQITRFNSTDGCIVDFSSNRNATVNNYTTAVSGDELARLRFLGYDGANQQVAAQITAVVDGTPGTNDMPGRLVFSTTADGASSPTERMRIDRNGSLFIAQVASESPGVGNTTTGTCLAYGVALGVSRDSGPALTLNRNTTDGSVTQFYRSGVQVGRIDVTASTTSYVTSSDYRLKENITPVTDGITRLQQLKPSRFNFIADPAKTVDGFIAHEVQSIVPECVTGDKDAVDADGMPIYQGIDQSKLVPLLTAALQEAVAKIEGLEARLTAAGL